MRCCTGGVYTLPTGLPGLWAACCDSCHRVVAQVAAESEEEVYADL